MISAPITATATISTNNETSHICGTSTSSRSTTFDYPQGSLESMSDMVIPGYRSRSAKGEIFNNPMSKYTAERKVEVGTFVGGWRYKSTDSAAHRHCSDHYRESVPGAPGALNAHGSETGHLGGDIDLQNLIVSAGTQAASNVDTPVFAGATFLAELRETIHFLRNPLGSFNNFLRDAKRSKNRTASGRAKVLGKFIEDNWLSYRFAVRPLVRDIDNAAVAIKQTVHGDQPKRQTARGSATDSESPTVSGVCTDTRYEYTQHTSTTVSVRAGVLYEFLRSPDTFGVDLKDIPVAMWEAIPYSFVVDRFLNIGSFIEAIQPKAGIRQLAAWTTIQKSSNTTRSTRMTNLPSQNGRTGFIDSDGLTTEQFSSVSTTRDPGITVGYAYNPNPLTWKGEVDVSGIIDLVALGTQLLRTR